MALVWALLGEVDKVHTVTIEAALTIYSINTLNINFIIDPTAGLGV